jgi:hypothetical protein
LLATVARGEDRSGSADSAVATAVGRTSTFRVRNTAKSAPNGARRRARVHHRMLLLPSCDFVRNGGRCRVTIAVAFSSPSLRSLPSPLPRINQCEVYRASTEPSMISDPKCYRVERFFFATAVVMNDVACDGYAIPG